MTKLLEDFTKFEYEGGVIYNGDCLEIMPLFKDKSVDAVITDPPYGTIACNWDVVIPLMPMWDSLERIRMKYSPVVLFSKKPFSASLLTSNQENYKYDWIWEKSKASGYPSVKHRPLSAHEEINVFYSHNYFPVMGKGKPYKQPRKKQNYDNTMNGAFAVRSDDYVFEDNEGDRFPRSVLRFRNSYYDDGKQVHPTQKPASLLVYLIKTYTQKGWTVLDFAMGSGTTGVACVQTGRKFIGIEIDPKYFEIAVKRIKDAQQQMRLPL
jgi:site-specific DNA-methyltransferase (adenine-specific)